MSSQGPKMSLGPSRLPNLEGSTPFSCCWPGVREDIEERLAVLERGKQSLREFSNAEFDLVPCSYLWIWVGVFFL